MDELKGAFCGWEFQLEGVQRVLSFWEGAAAEVDVIAALGVRRRALSVSESMPVFTPVIRMIWGVIS
jgi:hypothetical protein